MKFTKINNSGHQDALIQETAGLKHLRLAFERHAVKDSIKIKIPQVYAVNAQSLVLEQIDSMAGTPSQWRQFGYALAKLHQLKQTQFGWPSNYYIGMNPQYNVSTDDWGHFFYQYRLAYQVNLVKDTAVQQLFKQSLRSIQNQLIDFLNHNCEFPSLLHGDLWSGNVLFDAQDVWLIDPAIYCGDAEADLAMTELFGGFPAVFYQAYNEVNPLTKHYALKQVVYNLYHQLNHYNLFGIAYLSSCKVGFKTIETYFKSLNTT